MIVLLMSLCLVLWSNVAWSQQLSFPTAEGFGRFSTGGRGGKAYNINSLSAASGSGGSCNAGGCGGSAPFAAGTVTYKDCMTDRFGVGARTCIFRIGGTIEFNQSLNPWNTANSVTVAGQSAPGNGMIVRGLSLILNGTHNVIMRHMRHRNRPMASGDESFQVIGGYGCVDCIFDHMSFGWSTDDAIWCSYGADRCTFQWSLMTEGNLASQTSYDYNKFGGATQTSTAAPTYGGVSFLHMFVAQMQNRVPWQYGSSVQWLNNIVYNVGDASAIFATYGSPKSEWTNNYYKTGPQQPDGNRVNLALASSCYPPASGCTQQAVDDAVASQIYLSGNYQNVTRPNNTYPEDAFVVRWYSGEPLRIVTTKPSYFPTIPSMLPASSLADPSYLAKIGAYAVAGGSATVRRDAVDQRGIDSFVNNTGGTLSCASTSSCCSNGVCGETGSYPAGTPYTDTDGDGIADSWETAHSLDPNNAADGPALATNGYTNLENFLNELAGDTAPPTGTTLPPQLLLHWKLDESSGTSAADATGHGWTGTVTGSPTWTSGRVGGTPPGALLMDGTTSYVHNDTFSWPANQPITVAVWVNTAGGVSAGAFNIGGSAQRAAAHIPWSDNVLYWDYGASLLTGRLSTTFAPYLNQWTHVVLTANAASERAIWLNGTRVATSSNADAPTAQLTGVDLGRYAVSGQSTVYQSGVMDDFRLYTYLLTPEEIQALYRQTAGRIRHTVQGH